MPFVSRWPAALLLIAMAGCGTRPAAPPSTDSSECSHCQRSDFVAEGKPSGVDVLFMIDNSNATASAQKNLATNFPKFIEALRSFELGPTTPGATCTARDPSGCRIPDLHLGVVTSDLGAGPYTYATCETPGGDRGLLQSGRGQLAPAGCPTPLDPWIELERTDNGEIVTDVQNSTSRDPVEQVEEAFSCIAQLGTGGCGFEHQLESVRRALDGCAESNGSRCGTNPGFVRPDSVLAIVLETDEDDCSVARTELLDPSQQGLTDPLGPLNSFRCTEFGIVCAEKLREPGVKHDCVPGLDWLYPVDRYTNFFRSLKPPGRLILFALAGPPEPFEVGLDGQNPGLKFSCNSQAVQGEGAVPAVRIAAVTSSLGREGHFNEGVAGDMKVEVNMSSPDFSPALRWLGQLILSSYQGKCLPAPPVTPRGAVACWAGAELGDGVACAAGCLDQVDCTVQQRVESGPETAINKCPAAFFDPSVTQDACGTSCPCWRVVPDPDCEPSRDGSPYAVQIMRAAEPARGTRTIATCTTSRFAWGSTELAAVPQCR